MHLSIGYDSSTSKTSRRGELTDRQWNRLKPLLPPQKPHTGCPSKDHRTVINGNFVDSAHRLPLARLTRSLWSLENGFRAVLPLAQNRTVAAVIRDFAATKRRRRRTELGHPFRRMGVLFGLTNMPQGRKGEVKSRFLPFDYRASARARSLRVVERRIQH